MVHICTQIPVCAEAAGSALIGRDALRSLLQTLLLRLGFGLAAAARHKVTLTRYESNGWRWMQFMQLSGNCRSGGGGPPSFATYYLEENKKDLLIEPPE